MSNYLGDMYTSQKELYLLLSFIELFILHFICFRMMVAAIPTSSTHFLCCFWDAHFLKHFYVAFDLFLKALVQTYNIQM
jgi:hypothetical protein